MRRRGNAGFLVRVFRSWFVVPKVRRLARQAGGRVVLAGNKVRVYLDDTGEVLEGYLDAPASCGPEAVLAGLRAVLEEREAAQQSG